MATAIPANRCAFTADEIVRATGAAFSGLSALRVDGVGNDSRTIGRATLFVALRGVRDGHEFLDAAAERGAAAAVVERGRRNPKLPCFEVDDTLVALGELARFHLERRRMRRSLPSIAIGGAAGKTTTKELTAALARALFGEILATPGNLNNLIGVPMTLLMLDDKHNAMVIECGTNQRGEIPRLADVVRPDVALVLNADVEHTEGLGSLEGVADEEAALFSTAGAAVVGIEEPMLTARVPKGMRAVTFGVSTGADVRLLSRTVGAGGRQRISLALARDMAEGGVEPRLDAALGLLGAACALNATAAVAAVATAWARPLRREELAAMAHALESVEPVAGRLSTREVAGVVVIDDTYNANPRSVRAAVAAARETADGLGARLVVAMGDMLELGALAPAMHAEVVREIFRARPAACIAVGAEMEAAVRAAEGGADGSPPTLLVTADSAEASRIVRGVIRPGDVLLVKGSRGIAMERVIDALAKQ